MIEPDRIVEKVRGALGAATQVEVFDLTGTRDHYKARVVSEAFQGQGTLKRHRLVYGALAEEMKGPIHALTLEVYTPQEWSVAGGV